MNFKFSFCIPLIAKLNKHEKEPKLEQLLYLDESCSFILYQFPNSQVTVSNYYQKWKSGEQDAIDMLGNQESDLISFGKSRLANHISPKK